jgi:hypothetical protein
MQHTRTKMGKRCIGNQWRCKCMLRPLSVVLPAIRLDRQQPAARVD